MTAAAALGLAASSPFAQAQPTQPDPYANGTPAIVPKPVSMTTGQGQFVLGPRTIIAASSRAALPVAQDLAAELRPATGYRLPVVPMSAGAHGRGAANASGAGVIQLSLGTPSALTGHSEGYQLNVTNSAVSLVGDDAEGLFDGAQTIRQLLPGWIDSQTVLPGPWAIPNVSIVDYPRFGYRGFMIDIARHFEPPAAVERLIDIASQYKLNVLHIHLSDDQGFRVAINGFPNLTNIGAMGSVGTDGRTMDPGGFWTQAQYRSVVAYANAHFMTVVPEVDSPSHNNAIVMSEYNDTSNPLLNGDPQDILGCGIKTAIPPAWNFTTDVGYSGMCWSSANTRAIYTQIIDQLAKLSNSPYYDLGGDEASNVFTSQQYSTFVNGEAKIVQAAHEIPMGWAAGYATTPGTTPPAGAIAESWEPGATDAVAAVQKHMKVVMAPASNAYLDQSYPGHAGGIGLSWACNGCDLDVNYDWDPTGFSGVPASSVIGVEGALFGETIPTLADAEFLMLPRVMAIAEIGWSPAAARTGVDSPAFQDFAQRVAAQGTRLQAAGYNFYTSAEVPWQVNGIGTPVSLDPGWAVSGALGTVSAPGLATGDLTATVNWGDGSTSPAILTGTPPDELPAQNTTPPTPASVPPPQVNSLYTVEATHQYRPGAAPQAVTVTVTASNGMATTFHDLLSPRRGRGL